MGTRFAVTSLRRDFSSPTILALSLAAVISAPVWSARPTSQTQVLDWQAAAGGRMGFEVASVKRNTTAPARARISSFPLGPGDIYIPNGGHFHAMNYPLVAYIEFAYKMADSEELLLLPQLPKWATNDRFDIDATAQGNPTKDQVRLMMQSLLADRFKLAVHYETRQLPVYVLLMDTPGKLGPLLQQHAEESTCSTTPWVPSPPPTGPPQTLDTRFPGPCGGILGMAPSVRGRVRSGARNVTMELIASSLAGTDVDVNRPVLDRTGLTGKFDFAVEFTPKSAARSIAEANGTAGFTGPTFQQAVREQLGLKLEPTTGTMDVLVVDYVEEPLN
jgi:uncharacterized protein (TIGR03435 family)